MYKEAAEVRTDKIEKLLSPHASLILRPDLRGVSLIPSLTLTVTHSLHLSLSQLLVNACNMLFGEDLMGITALVDIRNQIVEKKTVR